MAPTATPISHEKAYSDANSGTINPLNAARPPIIKAIIPVRFQPPDAA
jgi:hypothetical protein